MSATDPRTLFRETIAPDEGVRFERLAGELGAVASPGKRALHPKAHAGVEAKLTIRGDVPAELRVGIFAEAGRTYRALARFSNGANATQSDTKPDLRGLALKILDVPGEKLIPGLEGATTQDFLFIHSPTVPFRSPEEFVFVVRAARSPALLLPRLLFGLGPVRTVSLLRGLLKATGTKVGSLGALTYYTVAALRFGPFAGKLVVTPVAPEAAPPNTAADGLRTDLVDRLSRGVLAWELGVQLWVDEATTPIEDATVEWAPRAAPIVPLARVEIPKQDVRTAAGARLEALVETLSFDPWHAPREFQPLGAVMRARNPAYRVSTQQRKAAAEPTLDSIPWVT